MCSGHVEDMVEVKIWADSPCQGVNKKGEQNKQRELVSTKYSVAKLCDEFIAKLKVCVKHCQEIRWIRRIQQTDFSHLPQDTLLIFSDFATSMCLRAAETKNSSVDAHTVNDNFVVIWNRRSVNLKTKMTRLGQVDLDEEEWEHLTIWSCDVHHFFAATMSKGKKMTMQCTTLPLMHSFATTLRCLRPLGPHCVPLWFGQTMLRCSIDVAKTL
jgi:hypothetical protein